MCDVKYIEEKVPVAEIGEVIAVREVSPNNFDMIVSAPKIAAAARAGQFVHVRSADGFQPFLRRPLSVGPCNNGNLRLIFTVRGMGTRLLSVKPAGAPIDLIGPLGHPFNIPGTADVILLVGGGIGIVPLLLLDDQLPPDLERVFLAGFRSKTVLTVSDEEFERRRILVATDDGTVGFNGNVVQMLEQRIQKINGSSVCLFGCGPGPMMSAVKQFCMDRSISAEVSLEVPMGCGVGACQACAVPRADGSGYLLVCRDGPVFDIMDVDLNPDEIP